MNRRRISPSALVLLGFLSHPCFAAVFTIDGVTRLNDITVPSSGVTHIRFAGAGYQTPGSLSLTNNGSDTLVFERASQTDSAVMVSGFLASFANQKGTVLFKSLSFNLNGVSVLIDTNVNSNNHNLIFDSCMMSGGGSNNRRVFSWGGDGQSKVTLSNSLFSQTGALSLTNDSTATLSNNLFNFPAVLTISVKSQLDMKYNTVNRSQFDLDGNLSSTYSIQNNYFANPPFANNLITDGSQKFLVLVSRRFASSGNVATNNLRDSTWDGFDSPSSTSPIFTDTSNIKVAPSKDSTVAWDWKIPGDNVHGAWNGPNPLPAFNLFPPDSTVTLALPMGNALFTVAASPFPRIVTAASGTASYSSSLPDSVRSWFEKDTALALNGALVTAISLPARNEGRPLLFAQAGSGFAAQAAGAEGASLFPNAAPAKVFIPAFAGQNTWRGSNVQVTGLGTDTALRFSSVTRAGRTVARAPDTSAPNGYSSLHLNDRPVAYGFTTDAEGSDSIRCVFQVTPAVLDTVLAYWNGSKIFPVTPTGLNGLALTVPFSQSINIVFIARSGAQSVLPKALTAGRLQRIPWCAIAGPKGAYRADGKLLLRIR